jgi:transcriptional regulator of aromatic amino acid metabolism
MPARRVAGHPHPQGPRLRVAALDAPLLVHGETGTGKELVARACHAISSRHAAPFLALNCAALPESLAESELFGYAPAPSPAPSAAASLG